MIVAVGIYVRVSTEGQLDNTSIDGQIELCKKKARELGYFDSNIKIYPEGRSGEDIDTRVELTKLRQDVANGLVSAVICTHPDRFSRDLTDKLIACRELEKNNASLYFTDTEFPDTDEGKLFFNMMSSIASYELSMIRKRTIRGRLRKVRDDKKIMPMRVAPFGYDKDETGQLVPNPKEHQFVQMIYEWYVLEKLTLRQIGERLYGKVKPKRGESPNWGASSISKILTSEIYIGKYYYNRRQTKKVRGRLTKGGKPKKTYTFRDSSEWLTVDVPPLVDVELWKMAQMQREKNDTNKHVGNRKYEYLLKSLLKCGHCSRTFDATTSKGAKDKETGIVGKSRRYRCPNTVPKKYGPEVVKCFVPSLNAEQIEDYVWGLVIQVITDPDKFVAQIRGKGEDSIAGVRETLAMLEKELKKKEFALENVERSFFEAETESERKRHDKHRKNYLAEISSLEQEIENYQEKIDAHRMEELSVEQITFMVNKLRERLSSGEEVSFDVKRNIIEMLFDEIIVTVNNGGGGGNPPNDGMELIITSVGLFDRLNQPQNDARLCSQPQEIRQHRRGSGRPNLHRHDRADQGDRELPAEQGNEAGDVRGPLYRERNTYAPAILEKDEKGRILARSDRNRQGRKRDYLARYSRDGSGRGRRQGRAENRKKQNLSQSRHSRRSGAGSDPRPIRLGRGRRRADAARDRAGARHQPQLRVADRKAGAYEALSRVLQEQALRSAFIRTTGRLLDEGGPVRCQAYGGSSAPPTNRSDEIWVS